MPTAHGHAHARAAYWRRNLRYVGALLFVWFAVSFGAGILFVEPLNRIRIPGTGFPLGFWFAQQGAIYAFVILIFVYVRLMNRLDREFHDGRPEPATGVAAAAAVNGESRDGPGEVGGPTGAPRGGEAGP